MGRTCCVPGCTSNYNYIDTTYVTSFKFPKDEERKKLWIKKINRKNFNPSSTAVVCINHFSEHFIVREDRARRDDGSELVVPRVRLKLTADAYPSIHTNQPKYLSSEPPPKRKAPSQRSKEIFDKMKPSSKNSDKVMNCRERWRSIRDSYKRNLNHKRNNEPKSSKYQDFPLEFLDEHVTDQPDNRRNKKGALPDNEEIVVKLEPPSPGYNSTISEDFILPDHNEEIAEPDPNSSSTKSAPDQPLVVLPQSNSRPQLSQMVVVRRTTTPSTKPTISTAVQQPFVVVGNDGLPKTTVVMNGSAVNNQPQFVMMPTTSHQQQPQFVVVGQQQHQANSSNNSDSNVTSQQQQPQFVVVGQQQQANTNNNSNVDAKAASVPPKVSSCKKKKGERVAEESDESDDDPVPPKSSSVRKKKRKRVVEESDESDDDPVPPKSSSGRKKNKKRVAEESDESDDDPVLPPKSSSGRKKNKKRVAEESDDDPVPPKSSSGRKKKRKRVVEESDDSEEENPVDSFFRSMAQTVKKFPPLLVAEAKMEVCRVVTRLECQLLRGRVDQPSNSQDCDSAIEAKTEESGSILGYSLFS